MKNPVVWWAVWLLVAIGLLFVWDTAPLYPFRIFAVFLHEAGHALATILTGGDVEKITLSAAEGGVTHTYGGIQLVSISAGYLGNLALGMVIFVSATKLSWDRQLCVILGIGMLVLTALYVRSIFGLTFCLLFGGALVLSGRKASDRVCEYALLLLGLFSSMYAICDIKSDVIDRSGEMSDARALAELTMVPTVVWGVLWILLSLAGILYGLWLSAPKSRVQGVRGG